MIMSKRKREKTAPGLKIDGGGKKKNIEIEMKVCGFSRKRKESKGLLLCTHLKRREKRASG
jgi:hypothetical protein